MTAFDHPPPYGLLHDWLGPVMTVRLLNFARTKRESFEESSIGYGDAKRVDHSRRRSLRLKNLGPLRDEIAAKTTNALPIMFECLGSARFEPCEIEMELVAHGDDAFFSRHIDTRPAGVGKPTRRIISAVYYFYASPKGFTGGALRVYSLNGRAHADIEPTNDTLVFFPSWMPHEVQKVSCPSGRFEASRFAINIWLHDSAPG